MNLTDDTMATIHDFAALTGIYMQAVSVNNTEMDVLPCRFCQSVRDFMPKEPECYAKINAAAHYTKHYGSGCVFFCPTGLCHITFPLPNNPDSLLLSDPIVCGQPDSKAFSSILRRLGGTDENILHIKNYASLLLYLLPEMIAKILRLLTALTGCAANTFSTAIQTQLTQAVESNKPENIKPVLKHISELVVTDAGLDIELTRSDYAGIIFTLYDIISDYDYTGLQENTLHFLPTALADADSIGKLEFCLSEAAQDFMHAAFSAITLKHNSVIDKAVELIQLHYDMKLTEELVANTVYMSPSYFSKIFKDNIGMGFTRYLNHVRIEKAKTLLANPDVPLDSIHAMLGFEYRNYFGRIFKAATGTTPGAYRMLLNRQKKV